MNNLALAPVCCAAAFLVLFASVAAAFSPASYFIRSTTTAYNRRPSRGFTSACTSLHLQRRSVLLETVAAAASALLSVPLPPPTTLTRLWLDADPSGFVWTGLDCDDDLAILVALAIQQSSSRIQLEGISVCGGNAPLRHTRKDMNVLLNYANAASLGPVLAHYYTGYGWRDMQVSRKWLQRLNRLQPDVVSSDEASRAIIRAAYDTHKTRSNDNSSKLTVLTLGPPTNLAKALEQDPAFASRIEHVYMMGGELTHQRLDLNFASDRAAARTVVNANVPTTLVPVQLCAQVVLDGTFVDDFERDYCLKNNSSYGEEAAAAACALLPKMRQQVRSMPDLVNQAVKSRVPPGKRWKASPNLDHGFIPWDIVTVLSVSHPELFDEWEYHRAEFPTCREGEPCDRTMVVRDLPRNKWPSYENNGVSSANYYDHSGIVRIPHALKNEAEVKKLTKELLGQVPGNPQMRRQPGIMLGFLAPVGAAVSGTLAILVGSSLGKMNL